MFEHPGAALGYADPAKLPANVSEKWSDEFVAGQDFYKLEGGDLSSFKEAISSFLPDRGTPIIHPFAPSVILFTESGAQLAAILSRTERSRAFRRFLVDVVLPEWKEATALPPPRQGVNLGYDDLGSVRYSEEVYRLAKARETRLAAAALERRGASARLINEMLVQNVSALLGRPVTLSSIPDRTNPEQMLRELMSWMAERKTRFAGQGADAKAAIGSWFDGTDWIGLRSSAFDAWCAERKVRRLDLLRAWSVAGYLRHTSGALTTNCRLGHGQFAPMTKMVTFLVDRLAAAEML